MNDLRTAAQQALEALEMSRRFVYADNRPQCDDAIEALRVTLKQEAEAAAWLAERKNHWRKEREKAQAAKDQDPELSAALGWPGGISNPVLDRAQLLQMVAALRVSAQQALEALEAMNPYPASKEDQRASALAALRAALAQQAEPRNQCGETCERAKLCATCARAMPQQAEPVAADALTEPKSGDKWRVEWWNESCRMMLPAHAKLDSFVAYKNGTIQFTIKRTAA